MSTITVGDASVVDMSMRSGSARFAIDTPPSNDITIGAAAEKPSARFQIVGSIGSLLTLTGSASDVSARRRPVAVVVSATSNADDGNGVMQWLTPSGLHAS